MKTTNTFLTLLASSLSAFVFGQTTDFSVWASDSLPTCTNGISFFATIGSMPETGGVVHINWGDGNTEQINFTTAAQEQSYYQYYNHTYATSGSYDGTVQVWSAVTNGFVGATEEFTVLAGDQNSCGYVYSWVHSPVQSVSYYDVPLDFTGAGNVTTTIVPSMFYYTYYSGLNPNNGPYTISINDAWLTAHNYTQTTPDQQTVSFDAQGYAGQFGFQISCGSALVDADVNVSNGMHGFFIAPLEEGRLTIRACNTACSAPADAEFELTFDNFLVPDIANITSWQPNVVSNAAVNGNVLTFDIDDLQGCHYLEIPFTFPGTTTAGTELTFELEATTNVADQDLSNNTETYQVEVLNSYDPNNKLVDRGQYIDHAVKEELRYTINFQNEGNYPALNIKVKDTLSANLDLSTFRLLGTSHGATYTIDAATRIVTFSFPMINLQPVAENEAASKGRIMYAISEMPGLPLNSEIKNTAYIYFDFNPAIITNTTSNINAVLGVNENTLNPVSIYPNPASGKITLEGKEITEVQIIDFTGKTVLKQLSGGTMNVAALPEGIYLVQVTTETGNSVQKLVIQH